MDKVNVIAVAYVLAMQTLGDTSTEEELRAEARRIKDTVYRALHGTLLTRESLELFIAAFEISEAHARVLFDLWSGLASPRVLIGDLPPLNVPMPASAAGQRFQTTQRHEFHSIGPEGQPIEHRTVQTIRSLVDGYSMHRYTFDMREATVARVHGGMPGAPYELKPGIWAVDITLPRVLGSGELISMEYVTLLHSTEPVPPQFSYAANQRVENILLRVDFHPGRLPSRVWWTEWEDYRNPPNAILYQEPMQLDAEYAVEQHLDVLERAVCGFSWEFA